MSPNFLQGVGCALFLVSQPATPAGVAPFGRGSESPAKEAGGSTVIDPIQLLWLEQIVRAKADEEYGYQFTMDVRSAVAQYAASLPPERRQRLSDRLAGEIEQRAVDEARSTMDAESSTLAEQFARGMVTDAGLAFAWITSPRREGELSAPSSLGTSSSPGTPAGGLAGELEAHSRIDSDSFEAAYDHMVAQEASVRNRSVAAYESMLPEDSLPPRVAALRLLDCPPTTAAGAVARWLGRLWTPICVVAALCTLIVPRATSSLRRLTMSEPAHESRLRRSLRDRRAMVAVGAGLAVAGFGLWYKVSASGESYALFGDFESLWFVVALAMMGTGGGLIAYFGPFWNKAPKD